MVGSVLVEVLDVVGRIEGERPPNWPSGVLTYGPARRLAADGFPVVWVPDAATLTAVLEAADHHERQRVLLDRTYRVLAHARSVLEEVTCPHLREWRDLVTDALECVREHPAPAQALALQGAVVVAQHLHGVTRPGKVWAAADRAAVAQMPSPGALRQDMTTLVFRTVLARFEPGDTIPDRPNRHVVAHVLSQEQYTPGNALEAVLLAVSVLRQTQTLHDTGPCDLTVADGAAPPGRPEGI